MPSLYSDVMKTPFAVSICALLAICIFHVSVDATDDIPQIMQSVYAPADVDAGAPLDHLVAAAILLHRNDRPAARAEARYHLLQIAEDSLEYTWAQHLLRILNDKDGTERTQDQP